NFHCRPRVDAERLPHTERVVPVVPVPRAGDAVQRVPRGAPVELEQDPLEWASAMSSLRCAVDPPLPPPGPRPRKEAGRPLPDALVDRWEHAKRLVVRDEAGPAILRRQ